jgi:signal transduction histidine kinase
MQRRLVASLIAAALVPLVSFGSLALLQVDAAVVTSLDRQTRVALNAAAGLLERDRSELVETTTSYATWNVLRSAVAAGDLEGIRVDVVDFQVGIGEVDAAAVASTSATISGGDDGAREAVFELARAATTDSVTTTDTATIADVGPRYLGLAEGIYQVAVVPIIDEDRTVGAIAMARRIDASTLVAIAQITGFEVAVQSAAGGSPVLTDAALLERVESRPPAGEAEASIGDGLAVGRRALVDSVRARVGTLMVVKTLDSLDVVATSLVALVASTLLGAAAVALVLAWALGMRLRRQAQAVAGWVAAVESGAQPPFRAAIDGDLRTVSQAVADLASALRRREERIEGSLNEISRLSPRLGAPAVAASGVRAARRVFDADEVVLVRPKQPVGSPASIVDEEAELPPTVEGWTADDPRPSVSVPIECEPAGVADDAPRPSWLVARGARLAGWTEPDRAIFALFARLLGIAIRDATLVDQAGDRAREAARLAALQADFLRGVSHNLQQPLTTILLVADEVAAEQDPARIGDAAATIRAEGISLARLVRQLLTMSRLDAGTMRIDVEPIAPAALVRNVWSSFRSTRRLTVDDRAPGVLAIADRACVEHIVAILLDNALKYAPRSAITARIEPRAAGDSPGASRELVPPSRAAAVSITISDSGPGVPPADRDLIFERFSRGSTSVGVDGTGLGLDVARGLARAMGGGVAYRDGAVGAAFELTLPAEPDLGPA